MWSSYNLFSCGVAPDHNTPSFLHGHRPCPVTQPCLCCSSDPGLPSLAPWSGGKFKVSDLSWAHPAVTAVRCLIHLWSDFQQVSHRLTQHARLRVNLPFPHTHMHKHKFSLSLSLNIVLHFIPPLLFYTWSCHQRSSPRHLLVYWLKSSAPLFAPYLCLSLTSSYLCTVLLCPFSEQEPKMEPPLLLKMSIFLFLTFKTLKKNQPYLFIHPCVHSSSITEPLL